MSNLATGSTVLRGNGIHMCQKFGFWALPPSPELLPRAKFGYSAAMAPRVESSIEKFAHLDPFPEE